jgi:hypothetical protein
MAIRKIVTVLAFSVMCLFATNISAQVNPDGTQPIAPGIPIPAKTDVTPNNAADTSRAAHRKPVKPPKEPMYDNKTVKPNGKVTKKSPKKMDEKDVPKK